MTRTQDVSRRQLQNTRGYGRSQIRQRRENTVK